MQQCNGISSQSCCFTLQPPPTCLVISAPRRKAGSLIFSYNLISAVQSWESNTFCAKRNKEFYFLSGAEIISGGTTFCCVGKPCFALHSSNLSICPQAANSITAVTSPPMPPTSKGYGPTQLVFRHGRNVRLVRRRTTVPFPELVILLGSLPFPFKRALGQVTIQLREHSTWIEQTQIQALAPPDLNRKDSSLPVSWKFSSL